MLSEEQEVRQGMQRRVEWFVERCSCIDSAYDDFPPEPEQHMSPARQARYDAQLAAAKARGTPTPEQQSDDFILRGTVDVIDHGACVIDTKTASRKPSGVSAAHRLQLATYATILELTWARTDTLVCTSRGTSYVPQSFQVTEDDRKLVRTIYPAVQAQMDAGLFSPNRNSPFCSRRCCRFWQHCEREWGGQVKEHGAEDAFRAMLA